MAHVHSFLSGELSLFEDLESSKRRKKKVSSFYHLVGFHNRFLAHCSGKQFDLFSLREKPAEDHRIITTVVN